jgi:hypothetical protein
MSKFHMLAIGQRFRWEDQMYRKVSPLLAVNEATGAQRMVPRAAVLQSLDGNPPTPEPAAVLKAAGVATAIEAHLARCLRAVEAQHMPAETREALCRRVRRSAEELLRDLKLA